MRKQKPDQTAALNGYTTCPSCLGAPFAVCGTCRDTGKVRKAGRESLQQGESMGVQYRSRPALAKVECTACGEDIDPAGGTVFRIVPWSDASGFMMYSVVHDDDACLEAVGGSRI